jgi:septum formation protein
MKKLLLASTSPRRHQIMKQVGLDFEVVDNDYEEDMTLDMTPEDLVMFLSKGKADSVVTDEKNAIIVSADTIVVHDGQVLGKPHTPERAKEVLSMLSGTKHQVMTGFTVRDIETGESVSKAIVTDIEFNKLSDEIIDAYVATGEPLDKAGAYGIQDGGAALFKGVHGDYYNVVGLPIAPLLEVLNTFGVTPFSR